jgi:hypothetical protein
MNESEYTREVTAALRQALPRQAVVAKLTDLLTGGLPDFFVSHEGTVNWFEAKKPRRPEFKPLAGKPTLLFYPGRDLRPLQWQMLVRLKRSWVLLYTEKGHGMVKVVDDLSWANGAHMDVRLWRLSELVRMILAVVHYPGGKA